ncbi:RNA polymerase Rpb4 [Thermoproteota archaeon]
MSETNAKKNIKNITLPEVKEYLEKVDEETADQIQRRTLDYVSKFSKISKTDALKMVKSLVTETKLSEQEAVEIVNIMPKSKEELYVFTSGWKKLLPAEISNKILKIITESSEKK